MPQGLCCQQPTKVVNCQGLVYVNCSHTSKGGRRWGQQHHASTMRALGLTSICNPPYATRADYMQVIMVGRNDTYADSYTALQSTQSLSSKDLGIHPRDASLFTLDGKSAPQRATITVRDVGHPTGCSAELQCFPCCLHTCTLHWAPA